MKALDEVREMLMAMLNAQDNHVVHWQKGNYTLASVEIKWKGQVLRDIGFAKCNPNYDQCDSEEGKRIATERAVKDIAKSILARK